MLGKLCKHEIKATARWFLPLFAITILLSPMARFTLHFFDKPDANPFVKLLNIIIVTAFVLSIVIVGVASIVLIIYRFYKNMVTDEGYLMHTLPVTTAQLIWSKLLVGALWSVCSIIVIVLAMILMFFTFDGFAAFSRAFSGFFSELLRDSELTGYTIEFSLELIILMLVSIASTPLIFYASIAIGQLFEKHKIIGSVAGYFGITIIGQFVGTAMLVLAGFLSDQIRMPISETFVTVLIHLFLPGCILVSLIIGAILFFIAWFIMDRKLNLD